MNRLEFLGKLIMVYCGDKNAFDDISAEQERLSIIEEKYKDCTQYYVNGFKEEIDRLNNLNKQLVEECQRLDDEETRLNNIISQIETLVINHNCDTGDIYYKYNGKYLKSELKERIIELVELKENK